ncbi:helix-turn-helix domain-containing protein [Marinifilum caeruleilacunae]|uniref:DNA-binding protein n=1 Tax=Marinifilum caeruleilacunae TaxID=2499076 RepID=A0ABX1X1V1_9BACT|nr:helix-turn-helix domain-containing protein [Marinifilum caeruleilacunae]NOU62289.1 DNA-binding protein [Marinifilum caeruleilacunae]
MEVITMSNEVYQNLSKQLAEMRSQMDDLYNKQFYPLKERWLDNQEVCHVLNISKRTLQTYRDNGLLAFSQYQAKIYYKASDIEKFLESNYNEAFQDC